MSDPPMTASATDSNPIHTDVIRLGNLAAFGLMSPTTAHTKTANDTNAMNQCFDAPIRSKRVRDCAYSVSVWVWSNMVDYGRYRTPELQSARGRRRRELQHKGTPLENDRQPWLKLGISKAWWYRKYRHAQE